MPEATQVDIVMMMWKLGGTLGLTALLAACGAESSRHGVSGAAGMGGTGAPSGGNGATGGTTDGAAAGGQGTLALPVCPEEAPEAGSECTSTAANCRYDICDDDTSSMFSCRAGLWQLTRACGTLDCPPERPLFLSDCSPLEGIECPYVEDCCDAEPATQTVVARCEASQWTVTAPSPGEACSFCGVPHENGTACDQPSACSKVGCYRTSCYSQPLVEECVAGLWRSQTLCSK